jgi:hypothetical protein
MRAARRRILFPIGAFAVTLDRTFPTEAQGPARSTISFGLRFGFDADPW